MQLERFMLNIKSRRTRRAGFTLITALAFSLIVGTVVAGIGTVAMSHYGRSKVEGSYSSAVALSDAGINAELRFLSTDPTFTTITPHNSANPLVGTISGVGGYQAWSRDWGSDANPCSGGDYTNPLNDVCIESIGTVDGITRRVRIRGKHKSVFDEYAIYALSDAQINGGGSGSGTTTIVGDMGTNGTLKFTGTKGTGIDTGTVYLNGSGAGSTPTGTNVGTNTDPVNFPTVSDWANKLFPGGGLVWLQTHNSNANIKQLLSTDTTLASEPTIAGLTLADVNSKLNTAGFTVNSRTFGDPTNSVPKDTSALDNSASSPSSWRFVQPATTYITSPYGAADQNNNRVFFVPPGDYYFNRLDFKSGTSVVIFLTHLGPIHLWVDTGNNQKDSFNMTALFTDPSPNKFRVFYNKCQTMDIAGNSLFPGGFYAVNPTCGPSTPMMNFTGGSEVLGSVITQYLTLGGSTSIVFPNNAGGDPTDFALWFGFKDNWKEVSSNGNPVFVDGTSN